MLHTLVRGEQSDKAEMGKIPSNCFRCSTHYCTAEKRLRNTLKGHPRCCEALRHRCAALFFLFVSTVSSIFLSSVLSPSLRHLKVRKSIKVTGLIEFDEITIQRGDFFSLSIRRRRSRQTGLMLSSDPCQLKSRFKLKVVLKEIARLAFCLWWWEKFVRRCQDWCWDGAQKSYRKSTWDLAIINSRLSCKWTDIYNAIWNMI